MSNNNFRIAIIKMATNVIQPNPSPAIGRVKEIDLGKDGVNKLINMNYSFDPLKTVVLTLVENSNK